MNPINSRARETILRVKGVTVDLRLVLAIWYIVLFLVLWRQIGKIRGDKVFSLFLNFFISKKKSLTYLIPIQERKQKGVPNFLNSITDAPEVMKLRFSVEKWLLRIFTVFFQKTGFAMKLLSQITKKGTKTPFFWKRGRGIFFRNKVFEKQNSNFFSLFISFRKMLSVFWLDNSILSY